MQQTKPFGFQQVKLVTLYYCRSYTICWQKNNFYLNLIKISGKIGNAKMVIKIQ